MSCSILVNDTTTDYELDDIDNNIVSTSNPLINGTQIPHRNRHNQPQSIVNLVAYLTRSIYFKRLKLIKLYMATAVIFLILFLILKSHSTNTEKQQEIREFKEAKTWYSGHESSIALSEFKTLVSHNEHEDEGSVAVTRDLSSKRQLLAQDDKAAHAKERNHVIKPNGRDEPADRQSPQVAQSVAKNFSYSLTGRDFSNMHDINMMQVRIREAAKHSWDNYRRYAWGFDMLKPRSKEPDHWFDLGLTIVDAADTLIMMGLTNEANSAIDWMENELRFDSTNANSNCFEMTIRILAGLLSAYHFTGSAKLKQQAIDFGDILLHCYDTESRVIPYSDIDLSTRRAHGPNWHPSSSLSEVASLQLEFRFLSQISGDPKYERTTFMTSVHLHNLTQFRTNKLLPMFIDPRNGQLEDSLITLGARSDSYYEYLLKQYLQTGIKWLETDYLDAMDEVQTKLMLHTNGADNYTYIADMQISMTVNDTEHIRYFHKMDHLVCFLPGTLILGYYHFSPLASEYRLKYNLETPAYKLNPRYNDHFDMAKSLARTCYHMYSNMGTGLAPEIANFVPKSTDDPIEQYQSELQVQSSSAHNILRPEFVESLFYLYHVTGLPVYRNQATKIFEAFQEYSRIPSGYSAVSDVRTKPPASVDIDEALHKNAPDRMESFWLSETLKYLYLIFCDDKHIVGTILNSYVFNTEAHLFPII